MKLDKLPIHELAIIVHFEQPLMALRSEHVGVFWSQIRKDFPTIEQKPPVMMTQLPGIPSVLPFDFPAPGEIFPMPCFLLTGADDAHVIQIQRDAFIVNWRRKQQDYPRYKAVKAEFDLRFATFRAFITKELGVEEPVPRLCELLYSNVLVADDVWRGAGDTNKIIANFALPKIGGGQSNPPNFQQVASSEVKPGLWVTVTAKNGRRAVEQDEVLVFELKASGLTSALAESASWFDDAHTEINKAFVAFTTEEARRTWKQ